LKFDMAVIFKAKISNANQRIFVRGHFLEQK